jgi:hypothetical protein
MNRSERRKLEQQQHTSTMPQAAEPPTQEYLQANSHPFAGPFWKVICMLWKWIFVYGFALLGVVAVFYDFSPKISVSPYQLIDSHDAFSAPFVITNEGYLSIRQVTAQCHVKQAQFELEIHAKNVQISSSLYDIAERMLPAEKLTVKCRLREAIQALTTHQLPGLIMADILIEIEYQPWLWYTKAQREFRFISARNFDGSWQWLPQPVNK